MGDPHQMIAAGILALGLVLASGTTRAADDAAPRASTRAIATPQSPPAAGLPPAAPGTSPQTPPDSAVPPSARLGGVEYGKPAPGPSGMTSAPGTASAAPASPGGATTGSGSTAAPTPGGFADVAAPVGGGGAVTAGDGGPYSAPGLGGGLGTSGSALNMIGDASPFRSLRTQAVALPGGGVRPIPPPARSTVVPSVREFKIAENQSPTPQDRVYFSFSFYDDVNKRLNTVFDVPLKGVQIYRYTWGMEKTFNNGLGSVGLQLPLNNVYAQSREPNIPTGGNSTALGNLTVFMKHILAIDPASGSLASAGLAISPRTGSRAFGGAPFLLASGTTTIQPFLGYFVRFNKLFFHGFEALDVPYDAAQATMIYNDLGVGYYLYEREEAAGMVRAIVPTFEVHANIPLNHRGAYDRLDKYGTPDVVNLTSGINVRLYEASILTLGIVAPVTGPRPFDFETSLLLNVYYGRTRRSLLAAPFVGG